MRCALIEAEKASYPIAWMCDQLGVARSSFYAWRAAADTVTATAARRQVLAQLVKVSSTTATAPTAAAGSRPSSTGEGTRPASGWSRT